MTTLTKTATRRVNSQIRALQRDRNDTLAGRWLPWGIPWCNGPGRSQSCQGGACEGCCTRLWCQDQAAPLAEQIRQLRAKLAPAVQVTLW